MAEERADHLLDGLSALLSRRGLGGVVVAGLTTLWQGAATDAKKKKKKKKPKTPPNTTPAPCTPHAQATTCAGGKCGNVTNNCGQQVNCGACAAYVLDKKIGGPGTGIGQFTDPVGIAIDGDDNLYVADLGNGRIQKLSNDGAHLAHWGGTGSTLRLGSTRGVAVDSAGYIYVASDSLDKVVKLDSQGAFVTEWSSTSGSEGNIFRPRGIAVDGGGAIWVSDANHRLLKFSNAGEFQEQIGGYHDPENMLYSPSYIASNGTLYVTDTGHHRVYRFPGGPFGDEGTGEGKFVNPRGIALDGAGNSYVVDSGNNRVQKFDDKGEFILAIGESQAADGNFGNLAGIVVDSAGNLFVVDEGRDCIHKFRPAGSGVGRRGTGVGRRETEEEGA